MRYPALRVIVAVHYVLAAAGALGIWLFVKASGAALAMRVLFLVGGLASVAAIVAVAEVLKLLMDIEANTRGPTAVPATPAETSALEQAGYAALVGLAIVVAATALF